MDLSLFMPLNLAHTHTVLRELSTSLECWWAHQRGESDTFDSRACGARCLYRIYDLRRSQCASEQFHAISVERSVCFLLVSRICVYYASVEVIYGENGCECILNSLNVGKPWLWTWTGKNQHRWQSPMGCHLEAIFTTNCLFFCHCCEWFFSSLSMIMCFFTSPCYETESMQSLALDVSGSTASPYPQRQIKLRNCWCDKLPAELNRARTVQNSTSQQCGWHSIWRLSIESIKVR